MKRLALVLTAFLSVASFAIAEDRALLIGVSAYNGDAAPLVGPANDLRLMKRVLTEKFDFETSQILTLADDDVTRGAVLGAFQDWLIDGTQPGDRVFIYYSGHGTQIADLDGDEGQEGRDEALVMVDFRHSDARSGVVTDDELDALFKRLAGRRVTAIVDACHSGTVSRSLTPVVASTAARARFVPARLENLRGVSETRSRSRDTDAFKQDASITNSDRPSTGLLEVWSSAASYQLAWETDYEGESHGVFTKNFAEAVLDDRADSNDNGHTSREELLAYINARSEAFCASSPDCAARGTGFTPQLEVPHASRILTVVDWPEEGNEPISAPTVQEMLDLITGGRRDVRLELVHLDRTKGGPIRPGDHVAFEIQSQRDGDVLLFDLRDGGVVHQLFPSVAFAKNTSVFSGGTLRIPDAYTQVAFPAPAGQGTLVALIVHDAGLVNSLSQRNRQLTPITDPLSFLGELMSEINGVWHGDAENRKVEFGMAVMPYAI
ncbi:MAG: caspase family protein [Pseudomonadota bacterium]